MDLIRSTVIRYFAAALLAGSLSATVSAQESALNIELNKLETLDSACRAYLVFQNGSDFHFSSMKLDLVLFDNEGVINKRLAVEGGNIPLGKTSVKLFDIKGTSCDSVQRVLLNDVLNCSDINGALENCIAMVEVSSKADAEFFK